VSDEEDGEMTMSSKTGIEVRVGMSVYYGEVTCKDGCWEAAVEANVGLAREGMRITGVGETRFDAIQDLKNELRVMGAVQ
jgi:hypothetical protein